MDEVGRGTTVHDGLAIALGTIHHLLQHNKCKTLFATHFHELAEVFDCCDDTGESKLHASVRFYQTDVEEFDVSHLVSLRNRPATKLL